MKSTRRRAFFASVISSSLIALTLSVGAPTVASAAEDDAPAACYPPLGAACLSEDRTIITAPKPKPSTSPLPTPTKPATEEDRKDALEELKKDPNARPVALSTSVTIGGNSENVQSSVTAKTGKGNVVVGTTAGATTQIKAGPYAPGSAGGYIQVWLSTSDKVGMNNLGRFTAEENGYFLLPAVTLEDGALATFILREECLTNSGGCPKKRKGTALGPRPKKAGETPKVSFRISADMYSGGREKEEDERGQIVFTRFRFKVEAFIYNFQAYKWDDYIRGTTENSKLIGKSILTVSGRAA